MHLEHAFACVKMLMGDFALLAKTNLMNHINQNIYYAQMNKAHQTRLFAVAHHALLVLALFLRHSKDFSISSHQLSQILKPGELLATEILYLFFLCLYKQITNAKKTLYHTNYITTLALSYSNTLLIVLLLLFTSFLKKRSLSSTGRY